MQEVWVLDLLLSALTVRSSDFSVSSFIARFSWTFSSRRDLDVLTFPPN